MNYLNIAATCPTTEVLGPGKRFVIWVQGCCFECPECGSPEWKELKQATLMKPADLAGQIVKTKGIEGITISGGEPMLQVKNLVRLVDDIALVKPDLSVICYTGYTIEELKRRDHDSTMFLSKIDVLIDGLYVKKLNDNKGFRGSSNQRIHFLTERYKNRKDEFINRKRDTEIYLFNDHYLMVGIKAKGLKCL